MRAGRCLRAHARGPPRPRPRVRAGPCRSAPSSTRTARAARTPACPRVCGCARRGAPGVAAAPLARNEEGPQPSVDSAAAADPSSGSASETATSAVATAVGRPRLARLHERRATQHHRRAPRVDVAGARRAGQEGGLSEIETALGEEELPLQDLGLGPQVPGRHSRSRILPSSTSASCARPAWARSRARSSRSDSASPPSGAASHRPLPRFGGRVAKRPCARVVRAAPASAEDKVRVRPGAGRGQVPGGPVGLTRVGPGAREHPMGQSPLPPAPRSPRAAASATGCENRGWSHSSPSRPRRSPVGHIGAVPEPGECPVEHRGRACSSAASTTERTTRRSGQAAGQTPERGLHVRRGAEPVCERLRSGQLLGGELTGRFP